MRVRVKVCGITNQRDADAAVAAGADALGFVFYPRSPRAISPETAASFIERLPPFVTAVGLFVNPEREELAHVTDIAPVSVLQFHGDEPESLCSSVNRPYIKAFNVTPDFDLMREAARFPTAAAYLLDAAVPGLRGGTGTTFDWRLWPRHCDKPLVLAGGLSPDNVAAAIAATRPYAVDVSGGVEGAIKGCKDSGKLERFISEVMRADRTETNRR
jgi:phosphoribosylanthranilate isomerase